MVAFRMLCFALVLSCAGPAFADGWKFQADIDFDLRTWTDNFADKGEQLATVVTASAVSHNLRLGITTGYVGARSSSDLDNQRGSIGTPIDTVVSASWRGFRPRIANQTFEFAFDAEASLPSGTRTLAGRQKAVVFDPLLARFDRYGEGLNFGLGSFVATRVGRDLSVGLGVKHTWTGNYAPDGDTSATRVDPADTLAFTGSINWARRGALIGLTIELADEGVSRRDGVPLLERGKSIAAMLTASLPLGDGWSLSGGGNFTTRQRDRRLNEATGQFEVETSRRDGDVWLVSAALAKAVSTTVELGVEGDFTSVGDGEIDPADFAYLPARDRWRIGPTLRLALPRGLSMQATVKYMRYRDRGSAFLLPLTANGINATVGLSVKF